MNQCLTVREVNFSGDTLLAVKDETTGKIFVAIKWICKALGLTTDQSRKERRRIQEDLVLSKGGSKMTLPTKGGKQQVLCLDIDYLPLWLAKINVNIINNQEIQNKLLEYQLKAKDVLAQAFVHKQPMEPMPLEDLIILQAQSVKELKARVDRIEEKVDITQEKVLKLEKSTARKALPAPADESVSPAPPVDGLSYLTATQVASALGVYSMSWSAKQSNKRASRPVPHSMLINALARELRLGEPDYVIFFKIDGGKKRTYYRYNPSAVEKIKDYLASKGYPNNLKVDGRYYCLQYLRKDNVVPFLEVGDNAK